MKKQTKPWKRTNVLVSVKAPNAKEVFVAGNFNEWNPTSHRMKQLPNGEWTLALELSPGQYEYKFIVDGQWCCEPGCDAPNDGCPACVPNAFGTMNRILKVDERKGTAEARPSACVPLDQEADTAFVGRDRIASCRTLQRMRSVVVAEHVGKRRGG